MLKKLTLVSAALVVTLWQSLPAHPREDRDGVAALLARLEEVLRAGQPAQYLSLLSNTADRQRARLFAEGNVAGPNSRVVVRERDREALVGTLPGDGYQLNVEVLVENGNRARLSTWRLDVRRRGGDADEWGIVNQQQLTTVYGLYRLALNPARQYAVRHLVIEDEDLRLTLAEGTAFVAEVAEEGSATALVLLGRGEMTFAPPAPTERAQLRLFANAETLQTPFEAAFVRLNPSSLRIFLDPDALTPVPVDPRELRRAEEIFRQDIGSSFGLDLGDLSSDSWSLMPGFGDLLAEVRTRRFDTLTYARSPGEVEDVSLFDRRNRRNISVYSSRGNAARYGRSYNEDDRAEYGVLEYDIEASFNPARNWIEGRTVLSIEVKADSLNSLSFRLADSLEVRSVTSLEFGRMLALRVRNQDGIVVNLPSTITRGYQMMIAIEYAGTLPPQPIDREALAVDPQIVPVQQVEEFERIPAEESFLYSNRSYWYPQPSSPNYATARLRLTTPVAYGVAASGELVTIVSPPPQKGMQATHQFHYLVHQPGRYFSCLITPLREVKRERIDLGEAVAPFRALRGPGVYYDSVLMSVRTQPRLQRRGRDLARTTEDILKFYTSLVGEAPYSALTLAVVERGLPGGHSPPYLAVLSQPSVSSRLVYRDDPASFSDFPEFFLAHELAHQWWGQGVGWKNYHEQWISEGFAQYFTALYARKARGDGVFRSMMRRMVRFGIDQSAAGPIWLGYRVGHIRNDSRAFRAVVYNKSAAVLHQLRGIVGDEVFFRGIRRFFEACKYKKAGTEEFRAAMEAEAGRPLERFFERWIYGDTLPQVQVSWREEAAAGGRPEAVVRVEQVGEELFEFPLQVSVVYTDRAVANTTVKVADRVTETRIPLAGAVRTIEANRDGMALVLVK